jgi:hypothetical protein
MPSPDQSAGSILLVDEYFAAEDERFLTTLRSVNNLKALAAFADRWKRDPRPWARQQMLAYLHLPLDAPGHQPVLKRLFRHAEQQRDHELLAQFLVVFDRLVRRQRSRRTHYDWDTGRTWQEEVLSLPRDVIPLPRSAKYRNPRIGRPVIMPPPIPKGGRLFRYHTRYYLRRRAWRYYRRLGFQRPAEYVPAISQALVLYRDEDLSAVEHALECWGLMHACFHRHEVLRFRADRIVIRLGRRFSELSPAPYFPELWQKPEALVPLLSIVAGARARLVRVWAIELVRKMHAQNLAALPLGQLVELLHHENPEVRQFGSELLAQAPQLAHAGVDFWLRLLELPDPTAVATICEAARKHLSRERLTLAQCIELACARAVPVARLGLKFVQQSEIASDADRQSVAGLARAGCGAIGREIALWALPIVSPPGRYDRDAVSPFFDSLVREVRDGAWEWLETSAEAQADAVLYARLVETPYDDVRLKLIDDLQGKSERVAGSGADFVPLWASVLLGVHRGGRQKHKAVQQLAAAIAGEPDRADELLPVLAASVRSVRAPERRSGLAAVVELVSARPELAAAVTRHLPELQWTSEVPA